MVIHTLSTPNQVVGIVPPHFRFESMKKSILPTKRFNIPDEVTYVNYDGVILAIFPTTAKWIVLENEAQHSFLELLKHYCLGDALAEYSGELSDAQNVVIQLVARGIENGDAHSCIADDMKQLHFYLTNGCNLHCPHCYMYSGQKQRDELSGADIKKVLTDFSSFGGKAVSFSGGEVTTRQDLLDIVSYAHSLGLRVRILTNGTLWTETMVKQYAPLISAVQVSVDGYSEETNARVRGLNNFNKAVAAIDWFVNNRVSTEMAVTPPYESAIKDESEDFIEFCQSMIRKYPSEYFKIKISEQIIEGREVLLTEEQNRNYFAYISKIKSALNEHDSELSSFVHSFSDGVIMDNCMYGVFAVNPSGDVFLCSRVSSLKPVCNVRTTPFSEIVKMSEKAEKLSHIDNFKPCKGCELRYICGGGCRIDYFPGFTEITDVYNVDFDSIAPRSCNIDLKHRFYRLMKESNRLLFK